jgi:phosphoribosylaminoimidazolecarboxamide formyltransferase/IMP cyclohydrolase
MKKIALISVSDKTGIIEFAQKLVAHGYHLISTGGTYSLLAESELTVQKVSDFTGYPEIMDGRVKTLNPKIHGGILGLRDNTTHLNDAESANIDFIDMVVVNLYPFESVVKNENASHDEIIENIDIGGPTMLRASAKNYKFVTVVTDPSDYPRILTELQNNQNTTLELRQELATKAFVRTKEYDTAISRYYRKVSALPEEMSLNYEKVRTLRYGENPHQKAAFFANPQNTDSNITNAKVLGGKELSFNNIVDANSAIELVKEFSRPTVVFIKHNNPCGVASSDTLKQAFILSHNVDSLSAFGAVVAMNGKCTPEIVAYIEEQKLFLEIIICTHFDPEALAMLQKKPNIRLLELGDLKLDKDRRDIKKVAGGILIQTADTVILKPEDLKVVTKKSPTQNEINAMLFAGKIVKHVKSNAIIFAKVDDQGNEIVTGIGAGQMSRVDSVYIARHKGGDKVAGSVMASDAFFPFPDGIEEAYKAKATAILQPGGSIKDAEVIAKADELGLSMVCTGIRSFRH